MSRSNGYEFPPKPTHLPELDLLTERLISPRIPYMQIRRLRRNGCYGIVGQVINVPVDVDTMVRSLPRALIKVEPSLLRLLVSGIASFVVVVDYWRKSKNIQFEKL